MNQAPRLRARKNASWRALSTLLAVTSLPLVGCNERPSDLREWRATDHDHTENPGSDQVQVDPSASAQAVPGLEDVTIVAWSQNCTQCHGQLGRGDGPRGPMLKATNLSDPAWQSSVTDEQIAASIKLGRGAMPSFKQLPDVTIANLVKLVRMMSLSRLSQHPPTTGSAAAPSGSASATKAAPQASQASVAPKPASSAAPAPSHRPSAP